MYSISYYDEIANSMTRHINPTSLSYSTMIQPLPYKDIAKANQIKVYDLTFISSLVRFVIHGASASLFFPL